MSNTAVKNLPTAEICELFKEGHSVREIAVAYKCSENAIRHQLKKGGAWPVWPSPQKALAKSIGKRKVTKKSRQRDIVNYLKNSTDELVTIEDIAKLFGDKDTNSASSALSCMSQKGLVERVGRGLYKKNKAAFPSLQPQDLIPQTFPAPIPAVQTQTSVESKEESLNKEEVPSFIEIFEKIISLAKECGGMGKLIEKAKFLEQQGCK